jgi:hypothetical protein
MTTMPATLDELERRLAVVEQKVARLSPPSVSPIGETPAQRALRLLEQSRRDKPRLQALMAKVLTDMGVSGEPVSPQSLREMMAADGVRPEENLFSRGIQEMREE